MKCVLRPRSRPRFAWLAHIVLATGNVSFVAAWSPLNVGATPSAGVFRPPLTEPLALMFDWNRSARISRRGVRGSVGMELGRGDLASGEPIYKDLDGPKQKDHALSAGDDDKDKGGARLQHDAPVAHQLDAASGGKTEAYAISLMGAVLVVMTTFYFVNSTDTDIVLATWQVLSMTVSIFCAVMLYGTTMGILQYMTGLDSEEAATFLNLGLFLVLYAVFQAILFLLMRSDSGELGLKAVGTIFAHITGFAGMYFGAGLLALPTIENNRIYVFFAVAGLAMVLTFLSYVAGALRHAAALADDGHISSAEREWMEVVGEIENDVFSLCLGFAVMQVIRQSITGNMHPYEAGEQPLPINQVDAHWLLGCSVILTFVTIALSWLAKKGRQLHSTWRKPCSCIRDVTSASMA